MLPALEVGRIYRAEVRDIFADGRILLEIGGVRLRARCETAVRIGETVELEVDRLRPGVVLKIRRIPSGKA